MKKFFFPLKSVGVVREARELRMREAFGVALRAVVAAEEARAALCGERIEFERNLLTERARLFRPADQASFLQAHQRLIVREAAAIVEVEKAVANRELRRSEWLASRRDLRLIEKLEQTARLEYRLETEREAQRQLDDRAPVGTGRGMGAAA